MTFRMTQRAEAKRQWHPRQAVPDDEQRPASFVPPRDRRTVIVIDHDSGHPVMHIFQLLRTRRIDSYRIVIDGTELRKRGGWSQVCSLLRCAFPRLASPRHFGD